MDEKLSQNVEVKASFKDGNLEIELDVSYGAGSTKLVQSVSAKVVLDAIGKLGTIEAEVVKVLEAALLPAPAAAAPSA